MRYIQKDTFNKLLVVHSAQQWPTLQPIFNELLAAVFSSRLQQPSLAAVFSMSRNALLSGERCVTSRKTAAKDTNIDAREENFSVTKHALLLMNTVFGGICKTFVSTTILLVSIFLLSTDSCFSFCRVSRPASCLWFSDRCDNQ